MLPKFGGMLGEYIARAELTQKAFAAKVGISQPYLSRLLRGDRAIPYKGVEDWPGILGLTQAEAQEFLLAADLTRTPKRVLDWIAKRDHEPQLPHCGNAQRLT